MSSRSAAARSDSRNLTQADCLRTHSARVAASQKTKARCCDQPLRPCECCAPSTDWYLSNAREAVTEPRRLFCAQFLDGVGAGGGCNPLHGALPARGPGAEVRRRTGLRLHRSHVGGQALVPVHVEASAAAGAPSTEISLSCLWSAGCKLRMQHVLCDADEFARAADVTKCSARHAQLKMLLHGGGMPN